MKSGVFSRIIMIYIVISILYSAVNAFQVPSDVQKVLEEQGSVDIFVHLKSPEVTKNDANIKIVSHDEKFYIRDKIIDELKTVDFDSLPREKRILKHKYKSSKDFDTASTQPIILKRKFSSSSDIVLRVDSEGLEKIKNNYLVESISLDRLLSPSTIDSTEYGVALQSAAPVVSAGESWGLKVEGINITGSGRSVCVLDSGIDASHPAFGSRVLNQKCFCSGSGGCCPNGQSSDNNATDSGADSHGTHISGIVGADYGNLRGIAPTVGIVAVKVCSSTCALSDLALGIEYCTNVSSQYNVSVLTMSVGDHGRYTSSTCPTDLDSYINNAYSKNLHFFAASDNQGYSTGISHPGCSVNTTSVGATDDSDSIASFSNYGGDRFDIFAPGVAINSTTSGGNFSSKQGTSMATPMAAGAAALIYQALNISNIVYTPLQVEQLMKETGAPVSSWTRVDIGAALTKLLYNYTITRSAKRVGIPNISNIAYYSSTVPLSFAGRCATFSRGNIYVNVTNYCAPLNSSANITMINLSFTATPRVLSDGLDCNYCSNISYNNRTLSFSINSFNPTQNFTVTKNANITIWDSSDSENLAVNTTAVFYANYTNSSSGYPVNTTNACFLSINATSTIISGNMTLNATTGAYSYNTTISVPGTLNWTVNCTSQIFESLTANDTVLVKEDLINPNISIISPLNDTIVYNHTTTIWFNASDNFYQTITYIILINGAINSSGTINNASTRNASIPLIDGQYNVTIRVIDESQNSVSKETIFWVDRYSAISLISPAQNANLTILNTSFFWNVTHASVQSLNCTIYNNDLAIYNVNATNSSTQNNSIILEEGQQYWYSNCLFERFGKTRNVSSETRTFTIDTTGPTVSRLNMPNNTIVNSSNFIPFNINISENVSTPTTCVLFINDTITETSSAPNGALVINQTLLNGSYSWFVSCANSFGLNTTTQTFTFTVDVTNIPPTWFSNISNFSTSEDTPVTINLSQYVNDTNNDPLKFSFFTTNASIIINNNTKIANITPQENFTGLISIVFNASDILNASTISNNVTLNVTPINDPPFITGNITSQSWEQGNTKSNAFSLYSHFSDIDNTTLTFTVKGNNSIMVTIINGSVSLSAGASYTGSEIVNFTASDGEYNVTSNQVTLTVTAVQSSGASTSGGGSGGGTTSTFNATKKQSVSGVVKQVIINVKSGTSETFTITSNTLPITKISIIPASSATQSTFEASLITGSPTTENAPGEVYSYFSMTLSNINISQATINFKIPSKWFENYSIEKVKIYRYTNEWTALPTIHTSSGSDFEYYEATTPGFSTFAISSEKIIKEQPNQTITMPEEKPLINISDNTTTMMPEPEPVQNIISKIQKNWIIRGFIISIIIILGIIWLKKKRDKNKIS